MFYTIINILQFSWSIYILTQPYDNWALTTSSCCMLFVIILQVLYPITWRQRYFRDLFIRYFMAPDYNPILF